MELEKLKFPIGRLKYSEPDGLMVQQWIDNISHFPFNLKKTINDLTPNQLEWKYRPDGWTIRQVVHHCADSHINAQLRFKLALTENKPTIKPYLEASWAELPDIKEEVSVSVDLLTALHKKWVFLLENLSDEDLNKEYIHPEHNKIFNLKYTIAMYSWHCRHHFAHVLQAIEHRGEFK